MNASASVLVVDDDADVRTLVRELLSRAGYAVSEAPDGRAALRVLYEERPDLIVLDVSMPGLDGWGTLERIRELSDVPVVMLSALGAELEKVRALRGGADDYVTKPFGRQELLARVESVLRRAPSHKVRDAYVDGLLEVDFAQRRVTGADGQEVELTPLEFRLLARSWATRTSCWRTSSCSSSPGAASAAPRATRSSSTSATCGGSSRLRASRPTRSRPFAASATDTRLSPFDAAVGRAPRKRPRRLRRCRPTHRLGLERRCRPSEIAS